MAKRKRSVAAEAISSLDTTKTPSAPSEPFSGTSPSASSHPARRSTRSSASRAKVTNPNLNQNIIDAPDAFRASPDELVHGSLPTTAVVTSVKSGSGLPNTSEELPSPPTKKGKPTTLNRNAVVPEANKAPLLDPTGPEDQASMSAVNGDEDVEGELKEALGRPPPVNSAKLPLPWKGRLGYACLNTYLRTSNPPVFSSRTCRISSILDHRHPLSDPQQPEHPTKNRPDKAKPASLRLGQEYVEAIGLANARDIVKMVRWNDRYGIKFMRLSSEMFPFASHEEYGYKLAPFAAETLAEAGKVIGQLGHRVTTHPGQFTQLGSPRKSVIDNAIRDLEYHEEMLSLLKLPEQQDRDAVMVLHMGGAFGDKAATLDRFRTNYAGLSQGIKNRLVLENDDVSWNVHDLLPICHELNIPLVLDFHHHNILFDKTKLREGTLDIMNLYDEIASTWKRKGITQKMHYSEQTPAAITPMERRKHSPRVMTLPPCPPDMDLMIEAKDKEQAVFELMRTFKLPGFDLFNEVIPHMRQDENNVGRRPKPAPKKKAIPIHEEEEEVEPLFNSTVVAKEDVGMGGPERRVYWPVGMEEWLKPAKRVTKNPGANAPKKGDAKNKRKVPSSSTDKTSAEAFDTVGAKVSETQKSVKKAVRVGDKKEEWDDQSSTDAEDVPEKRQRAQTTQRVSRRSGRKNLKGV